MSALAKAGQALYKPHPITTEPALKTVTSQLRLLAPFVAGFGVTGYIFLKVALGVTDEDVKKSKFANPHQEHH